MFSNENVYDAGVKPIHIENIDTECYTIFRREWDTSGQSSTYVA